MIALGSLGRRETAPGSRLDLLFLTVGDPVGAERAATETLARLDRLGSPFRTGLILGPKGGKGPLVWTEAALLARDLTPRERFALGSARLVAGRPDALGAVARAVRARPLEPEELGALVRAKRRIETERVRPTHVRRDVRLGRGGLDDVEWTVRLIELAYPTDRALSSATPARLDALTVAGHLNLVERDLLFDARRGLLDLRHRLWLADVDDDLLPENPDRLARLAADLGLPDANALLRRHAETTDRVRALYEATVRRL